MTTNSPASRASAGDTSVDKMTYEQARDELVAVVARLEAGGETLEGSLALWERGEQLAARCQEWLDGARARLDAVREAGESSADAVSGAEAGESAADAVSGAEARESSADAASGVKAGAPGPDAGPDSRADSSGAGSGAPSDSGDGPGSDPESSARGAEIR